MNCKLKITLAVLSVALVVVFGIFVFAFAQGNNLQEKEYTETGFDTGYIAFTDDGIPIMASASLVLNTETEKTWEQKLKLTIQDKELIIHNVSFPIHVKFADVYYYEIVLYSPALMSAGASYSGYDKLQYVEIQGRLYDYTLTSAYRQMAYSLTVTPDENKTITLPKKDKLLRIPMSDYKYKLNWFDVTAIKPDGTLHTARVLTSDLSAAKIFYEQVWTNYTDVKIMR